MVTAKAKRSMTNADAGQIGATSMGRVDCQL